jgi:hypothetical protein
MKFLCVVAVLIHNLYVGAVVLMGRYVPCLNVCVELSYVLRYVG